MKFLGIDYGTKRVGIAVSDDAGMLAFPHSVIPAGGALVDALDSIAKHEWIGAIVIGESRNFQQEANPLMRKILELKAELEQRTGLPIYLEPEFLSSRQAEHIQGKEAATDASAAALILQSYIDRNKNAKP